MLKLLIKHQLCEYAIDTVFDRLIFNFASRKMKYDDIQFGTTPGYEDGSPRITIIHNGVTYVTYFTRELFNDIALVHGKLDAQKMLREALAYEFHRFTGMMVVM